MVNNVMEISENEKETTCRTDDNNVNGHTLSGCSSNDDACRSNKSYARRRKCNENVQVCEKKKRRESYQRISSILRKTEESRTVDELKQLDANVDIVRQILKRREHIANTRERILEKEDPPSVIEEKARKLANVLSRAQHLICYTGAGISTSAQIPDYRGSQGIWTLLQQGKEIGKYDLSMADPTFTHMALYELHRRNILRYTLSQNCDGLHLRSGLPRKLLSEVHGNMYIEVCKCCKPNVEYWRLFDTTERTARYNHKTNRRCHVCFKPLIDTIVHFGERGRLKWPLNWESACKNAEKADVILCLGSSLKVLKKYTWLWQMERPKSKRPKIYIVNLQWTPKDKNASLKINGKCDEVMKLVMKFMNINVTPYNRQKDPIFAHASLLNDEEVHTVSQPMLRRYTGQMKLEDSPNDVETKIEPANEGILVKTESNEPATNEENVTTETKINDIKCENRNESSEGNKTGICPNDVSSTSGTSMNCQENNSQNDEKPIKLERFSEVEKDSKDCSNKNHNHEIDVNVKDDGNDDDAVVKLPPTTSPNEQNAEMPSQCHEISTQPHDNTIDIGNNTNLIEKGTTARGHCLNLDTATNDEHSKKPEFTFAIGESNGKRDEVYLKSLINYYRAIEGVVPHWYDVNYAYSGLHSIINPPPNEVDIWSTIIIPIFQLNRNLAECEFCFENYAEDKCQFYKPLMEFSISEMRYRNGKRILCECCDYDDFDNDENNDEEQTSLDEIDGSEEAKTYSDEDDTDSSRSKRVKIEQQSDAKVATAQRIIQPGWYGKGYRKTVKRKKTRKLQLR